MSIVLPESFEKRLQGVVEDYPAFAHALCDGEAEKGLFVTNKITSDELRAVLPFDIERLPYSERGFRFDAPLPGRNPLHHAGAFYVQDPSAQATVACAPVKAGMKVLDTCASPGGKSIALGCLIGDDGLLVSNEVNRSRARVLASNIERVGLKNTVVTCVSCETLGDWYDGFFDLVLTDAPCSGEGMFRKYPAALDGWNDGMVRKCSALQHDILESVCNCVKPGGYLLYSTCTFSPEENEYQIESFLDAHTEFTLCKVNEEVKKISACGITQRTRDTCRLYPHLFPGEGQFVALLQRADSDADERGITFRDASVPPSLSELTVLSEFLRENTDIDPAAVAVRKCKDGLRVLSCEHPVIANGVFAYGVCLGSVEKGVFRPHHQFFSAYGDRFTRRLNFSSCGAEAADYLAGRGFLVDSEDGWCSVSVDGASLGGGKVVCGMLKNHYPKGLRQA